MGNEIRDLDGSRGMREVVDAGGMALWCLIGPQGRVHL